MSKLNESRKTNWKDSDVLTLVKTADGRMLIETKDRYYDYKQMSEALYEYAGKNIKLATERDVLRMIDEDYVDSEGAVLNEVRYDWNHIDPITGMPKVKAPRPEESIELMNRMPTKTGWIVMLQNRVNFNSTGNIRYAKKVWFDRPSSMVADDESMTDAVHFRTYMLPHCGRPGGWMYLEDYQKLTHRRI